MTWENPWDAYVEDPGGNYLLRIGRDNRMVITVESLPERGETFLDVESIDFWYGLQEAAIDAEMQLPFDSSIMRDSTELYHDGYTAGWFPVPGEMITCGNRTDLPRKQRVHDYVSLGIDIANHGEKGIVEVIVFACSACGRDWR